MIEKKPPRERYDITIKLHKVDALVAQGTTIAAAAEMVGVSISTYRRHRSGVRKFVDRDTARERFAEHYTPYARAYLNLDAL